ncbi:MAG: hypothetical protein DLM69_01955 [Candidatus Chloroheliales bacterium]|nr:MAG: hypothetical protein DLM69_01955 [Chloroflexota bacterium]
MPRRAILDPEVVYRGHPAPEPFYIAGNQTGVLLIHGYSGSPPEMLPVARYLHERGGYTVVGPLLPGHGTRPEDLRRIHWQQWANAVNYAYANLAAGCERIFLVGLSMGGVLALYQAERLTTDPDRKLAGVVSLAAPMYVNDWRVPFAPFAKYVIRWQGNRYTSLEEKTSVRDKAAVKELWSYLRMPSHAAHQLLVLMKQTRRNLATVSVPLLIIHSRHDTTSPPPSAQIIYDSVASADKQLVWLDNSNHVITVDYERDRVNQAVYDFINQHNG